MNQRTRRSPARFLAPLALIVVLIVFMAIVSGSGGGSGSSSTTDSTTSSSSSTSTSSKTSSTAKKKAAAKKKTAARKAYTVQAGDTFGSIATKTGLTVEQLQSLNPDADSSQLQPGQKLRVK